MNILSMRYTNETKKQARITNDDGTEFFVPIPCETWHQERIDEFLNSGGVIEDAPAPPAPDYQALRRSDYAQEADPLLADYLESQERGLPDAEEKKQVWLAKKDEIRLRWPVPEESA